MPDDIAARPARYDLATSFAARLAYQSSDYLGRIGRAKRPETHSRRIDQMLEELESGEVYMNMKRRGPRT